MYIALGMLVFFAHWSSLPPEVVLDICGSTSLDEWMSEWMNGWMKWNWQGLIHTLVHFPDVNVEARRDVVKPPHHKAQLAPLGLTLIPSVLEPVFSCFLITLSWPLWRQILHNRFVIAGVVFPPSRAFPWRECVYSSRTTWMCTSILSLRSLVSTAVSQLVALAVFSLPFGEHLQR